jgi:hypothetical protein
MCRGSVRGHAHPEDTLTIDETIRDLLDVSTDVVAVAVLDPSGAVVARGPGAAGTGLPEAAARLWDAAVARASLDGDAALEHVVVPVSGGAVAVVHAYGRRAVALTGARPAVALLLFDLRTCLGDAYADGEPTA